MTDPELIREVLTKYYKFQKNHHDLDPITKFLLTGIGSLEGDPWSRRRKIINSAFQFEKLKVTFFDLTWLHSGLLLSFDSIIAV